MVLFGAGGAFWFRSPVLVVTDSSFNQLYGPLRFYLKGIVTSLKFFRRLITVTVAESAGSDLIRLAVEGSSRLPGMVLFPYRYIQGAQQYKEAHPAIPVFVMGGGNPKPRGEAAFTFVTTDTAQDLYRAGLCAAILNGEGKSILFFTDGVLSDAYRKAFQEGLRAQGFLNDPVYANASADYSSYSSIGCVVVDGPASKFIDRNLKIPVILFSWVDPATTPRAVKLVFDDSPLALAAGVLRSLPPAGEVLIPSEPIPLPDRIDGKKDFRNIQALIKEKFQEK